VVSALQGTHSALEVSKSLKLTGRSISLKASAINEEYNTEKPEKTFMPRGEFRTRNADV